MTASASVGTLSKFGMSASLSTSHVTAAYEYKSFNVGKHGTILSTDGIRGTREHPSERTRDGTYTISGQIGVEPGPADLDVFLQWILGGTKSTNTIPVAETLSAMYIEIDRIAKVHQYAGCYCDKGTFKATQGGILELMLDVEGKTETILNAGTFPALTPSLAVPYVFTDATITLNGTSYQFRDFELTIDNHLKKDRFMNSVSRTDLPALDRIVSLSLNHPYTSDTTALYDLGAGGEAQVVLTFTNGGLSCTFTMVQFQVPTIPPETPGRDEIILPLKGICRSSSTTKEIVLTNVSS